MLRLLTSFVLLVVTIEAKSVDLGVITNVNGSLSHQLEYNVVKQEASAAAPIQLNKDRSQKVEFDIGIYGKSQIKKNLFIQGLFGISIPINAREHKFSQPQNKAMQAWRVKSSNSNIKINFSSFLGARIVLKMKPKLSSYALGLLQYARPQLQHNFSYGKIFSSSETPKGHGLGFIMGLGFIYQIQPKLNIFTEIRYNYLDANFEDFHYSKAGVISSVTFQNPEYNQGYMGISIGMSYKITNKELR